MIRLGLRLTLGSGREAALRVLVTAAAVALGVGLLLFALAGMNGLHAQTDRGAWLDTSAQSPPSTVGQLDLRPAVVAAQRRPVRQPGRSTGSTSPPPDRAHRSRRGFRTCPDRANTTPRRPSRISSRPCRRASSRDRFPGRQIGTIGAAALPSPNSLIIVIGHDARQLSQVPGAVEVRGIQHTPSSCYACQSGVGSGPVLKWILAGGAVALLLPVLILIATASRLSAARREERFAAMRLVGATPRQVSVISAVEATVAAVAGVAVGFALFFLFRPLLIHVPFAGAALRPRRPLAPGDRRRARRDRRPDRRCRVRAPRAPPRPDIAARRESTSVVRPAADRAGSSRSWPASPCSRTSTPPASRSSNGSQILELLVGFVLILVGLFLAGPWLTKMGSRLMAKRATSPRHAHRRSPAPRQSQGGLPLDQWARARPLRRERGDRGAQLDRRRQRSREAAPELTPSPTLLRRHATRAAPPPRFLPFQAGARGAPQRRPGCAGVTVVHVGPSPAQQMNGEGLVACDQLAKTPAIGKCAPGATVATIGYFLQPVTGTNSHPSSTVWPSAHLSVASIASLPVEAVVVATDGSSSSLERARTSLERAFPFRGTPVVVEGNTPNARASSRWSRT